MSKLTDERELLSKPGDTILETIEQIGMNQVELAERMGKTPSKVNDLISGKEPITMATALQLEKVLAIDAQFWLNREMIYREKLIRLEQDEELEKYKDWLKILPLKELKAWGYLQANKMGSTMIEECLKFYGVATPSQWESVYVNQYFRSSFRKSEAHNTTLGGLSAFLRIGEIEVRKLKLKPYDKEAFKKVLKQIRTLVRTHPYDFAKRLQEYCSDVGVALVYTANISKAPVSGVARWVGGSPLIQLTDRYKSNDHFWFSFFHEAGHILLHGKKGIFVEDFNGISNDSNKEIEADNFANKLLLPEDITSELPSKITEKDIRKIARKYNTHSAVVVGRLQRLKKVPYSFGNNLKLKVILDEYINKN